VPALPQSRRVPLHTPSVHSSFSVHHRPSSQAPGLLAYSQELFTQVSVVQMLPSSQSMSVWQTVDTHPRIRSQRSLAAQLPS
jgi:hypothetical protein